VKRVSLYLAALTAAILVGGCEAVENRFVYYPTHRPEPVCPEGIPLATHPSSWRAQPFDLTTADGTRFRAWWCPCPGSRGAILYCHGTAGDLSHRAEPVVALLEALGESVLVFDYPGFGLSEGKPSEAGCYAAADAAYDWLTSTAQIPADRVILYGVSLGGGVAVDLASRRPARALVLVKTFTSIPDVAAHILPFAPVRQIMVNRYDNLSKIPRCNQPLFVVSGIRDHLVPYDQGLRLFEAGNEPKQFYPIEGRRHNQLPPPDFYQALAGFLAGTGGGKLEE
jgi:fermentation-respiration switch protein FrsA (DUF1100 family)